MRLGIQNLAGVPSVVFGLFGLALFVGYFHLGISIAAGSLTLGLLILPTVIGAGEEALRQVPSTFREASLGLGATRWQTIRKVVLPAALPGILTGSILGIGRAAGETAPIMFTAATFYTIGLPRSPLDEVMALPYHIYVLATAGTHIEQTRPLQYGTVLVLDQHGVGPVPGGHYYPHPHAKDQNNGKSKRRRPKGGRGPRAPRRSPGAAHHRGEGAELLLRRLQGPDRYQHDRKAQSGDRPHRTLRAAASPPFCACSTA